MYTNNILMNQFLKCLIKDLLLKHLKSIYVFQTYANILMTFFSPYQKCQYNFFCPSCFIDWSHKLNFPPSELLLLLLPPLARETRGKIRERKMLPLHINQKNHTIFSLLERGGRGGGWGLFCHILHIKDHSCEY